MDSQTDLAALAELQALAPALTHVQLSTSFRAHRDIDGQQQIVHVQLLDAGPHAHQRYQVSAETEHGSTTLGPRSDSVAGAISGVRWSDLDA